MSECFCYINYRTKHDLDLITLRNEKENFRENLIKEKIITWRYYKQDHWPSLFTSSYMRSN